MNATFAIPDAMLDRCPEGLSRARITIVDGGWAPLSDWVEVTVVREGSTAYILDPGAGFPVIHAGLVVRALLVADGWEGFQQLPGEPILVSPGDRVNLTWTR